MKQHIPVRFSNAEGVYSMNACLLDIDEKTLEENSEDINRSRSSTISLLRFLNGRVEECWIKNI